jgi:MYXO-CTERM domain-containing protein
MRSRAIFSALVLAGVLAQPTYVAAQDTTATPATARDDDNDQWGWLGLLGLAGLLGLRRRDRVETRVNPRTT